MGRPAKTIEIAGIVTNQFCHGADKFALGAGTINSDIVRIAFQNMEHQVAV